MAESCVSADALSFLVDKHKEKLKICEVARAKACIDNIRFGASSCQKSELPACHCKNAKTAVINGREVTDVLAVWLKKKFVAGPFKSLPFDKFRVNSLMAIDQGHKVRPVLNVSLPKLKLSSFNDNINKLALEKVKMSTAKKFSYTLVEAGAGAVMSKFDMVDAYKNIPAPPSDLRLQGFEWLSRYFVELRQIFGAILAVPNFDILGNTISTIANAVCEIPEHKRHRILDDTPSVAQAGSPVARAFCETYKVICSQINLPLALDCPDFDKAFQLSTNGKVLGIIFNSENLSWTYPKEKAFKSLSAIQKALDSTSMTLKEFQSLLGRLNDVCQLCPFMKVFNSNLYYCYKLDSSAIKLSEEAKEDLLVWARFFLFSGTSLPICHRYVSPPLSHKYFTSDAAGAREGGSGIGCGSIGFNHTGEIIFAFQTFWH